MNLKVCIAAREDVYRDFARIPEEHRKDEYGEPIKEGIVCRISVGSRSSFVLLRGLQGTRDAIIGLDERKRDELDLKIGDTADFTIKKSSVWGEFRWAWNASDPAYRVGARLGVLSLVLGAIGLFLGIASMWK